ncbi:MAG: Gfo/Idh/MocA family oxidoreductase [Bryobacteraceae bacterium]
MDFMQNRREFLASLAVAAQAAPKIKIGVIGCGWYGMVDLKAAFKVGGVECAALCDVDSDHLSGAATDVEKAQGSRPRTFKHYGDLLDVSGLQAVIIATPPHWHALPFIDACRRNLDIYCEKPLAYDIREGRAMIDAAKRSKSVVQIGFQRREAEAIQQAARYIRSGNAGRIVQVEANIHFQAAPPDPTPVAPPASLDWDLWCGPGPKIPYSLAVGHKSWRLEATVGNGHLVDWGIHLIDAARHALGEKTPRMVNASGGIYALKGKITTPDTLTAHFEFGTCPLVWRHRIWGSAEWAPEVNNGIFFYGEQETVFATDDRWVVIPRQRGKDRRVTSVASDAGTLHMADFLDCIRTRRTPSCQPEDAWWSTTAVQLAMISYRTGTSVNWDLEREQILDNPKAARLLKRPYRAPYIHPYAAN